MIRRPTLLLCLILLLIAGRTSLPAQRPSRPPLDEEAKAALARLMMLEDTRRFDGAVLRQLTGSPHPEIRRRALTAIARIANPEGHAILVEARKTADAGTLPTLVFATGQMKNAGDVPWLAGLLHSPATAPDAGFEAARALGKIRTPEARAALADYLSKTPTSSPPAQVVGEALLAIGRFTGPQDIAPALRWVSAGDTEIRWRAAWALFRPRQSAAVGPLLAASRDRSPEVRFWALRGLAPNLVKEAGLDLEAVATRLREATRDRDRRVRTEALRALGPYDDEASIEVVLQALDSPDTWLSVSAAESLAAHPGHRDKIVPRLVKALDATRPLSLRLTALTTLAALDPQLAFERIGDFAGATGDVARNTLRRTLASLRDRAGTNLDPTLVKAALDKFGAGAPQGAGRGSTTPTPTRERPMEEYRRLVDQWVAPDYGGARKPRAVITTNRGDIEVELHPGDAPLGTEHFVTLVESGDIVGTEFGRVVPNFVAQQQAIRNAARLRDEVSRLGLTRGNLSWASAGLDTGRPGYTFGVTPQPHNEGDFTCLGRVIRGMDVVDRLELGDRVTAARMLR